MQHFFHIQWLSFFVIMLWSLEAMDLHLSLIKSARKTGHVGNLLFCTRIMLPKQWAKSSTTWHLCHSQNKADQNVAVSKGLHLPVQNSVFPFSQASCQKITSTLLFTLSWNEKRCIYSQGYLYKLKCKESFTCNKLLIFKWQFGVL